MLTYKTVLEWFLDYREKRLNERWKSFELLFEKAKEKQDQNPFDKDLHQALKIRVKSTVEHYLKSITHLTLDKKKAPNGKTYYFFGCPFLMLMTSGCEDNTDYFNYVYNYNGCNSGNWFKEFELDNKSFIEFDDLNNLGLSEFLAGNYTPTLKDDISDYGYYKTLTKLKKEAKHNIIPITFGKYLGLNLFDIAIKDYNYIIWLRNNYDCDKYKNEFNSVLKKINNISFYTEAPQACDEWGNSIFDDFHNF